MDREKICKIIHFRELPLCFSFSSQIVNDFFSCSSLMHLEKDPYSIPFLSTNNFFHCYPSGRHRIRPSRVLLPLSAHESPAPVCSCCTSLGDSQKGSARILFLGDPVKEGCVASSLGLSCKHPLTSVYTCSNNTRFHSR